MMESKAESITLINAHTTLYWHQVFNIYYPNLQSFRVLFWRWVKQGKLPDKLGGHSIVTKEFKGRKFYEIPSLTCKREIRITLSKDWFSLEDLPTVVAHSFKNDKSFRAAVMYAYKLSLGRTRTRIMTIPQTLWVGANIRLDVITIDNKIKFYKPITVNDIPWHHQKTPVTK